MSRLVPATAFTTAALAFALRMSRPRVMNEQHPLSETLVREIARYLAAVDLFRAEHCEPQWQPECAVDLVLNDPPEAVTHTAGAH